jgi:phage shock protein A
VGLLDRISLLVRSNVNDAIDRAEDPEKAIKQLLLDMNSQLIQVKTQVAAAIADEKRLRSTYESSQRQADEWQRKAELAIDRGEEDLAKEALQRRINYANTAAGLEEQWKAQSAQVQMLKDGLRKLESKISEADAKKELLIARHRSARAQEQMHKTLTGVQGMSSTSDFARLERKVEHQEARAQAYTDLSTDSLDTKFEALESESEVDKQLRELKAARQQSQLPPGQP